MSSISICCIVKNEEQNIGGFITSINGFADEIIVVDNGSQDSTVEIAKKMGAKVYFSELEFDLARNVYFEKASKEWILTMDVDERITINDYMKLKKDLDNVNDQVLCGIVAMNNYFGYGRWSVWFLPRVIRNTGFMKMRTAIHGSYIESVERAGGKLFWSKVTLHHLDGISKEIQKEKRERNIRLISEQLSGEDPDYNLLVNLATENYALGEKEEALKIIRKAAEILTDNASKCFRYYASIAYGCGEYQESIEAINEQIRRYNTCIMQKEVRAERAALELDSCNVILGKNYLKINQKGRTEELCRENIVRFPELSHNYLNLAIVSDGEAEKLKEKAKELNPFIGRQEIYKIPFKYNLYELSSSVWRATLEC